MLAIFAIFAIFSITTPCLTGADEILGCGGFIKSHIPIEYSRVEVALYTRQGSKKDVTDCAPNNGYYFLPVEDHGEYILRVSAPAGWKFEPSEVPVNVDGHSDPCSLGHDVNFIFAGFAVTGKVVSASSEEGPEGVLVTLLSTEKTAKPIFKAQTDQGGTFSFASVAPGRYVLVASREGWKMAQDKASLFVTADNYKIEGQLSVAGYPVSGKVTSDKEPIGGVSFVLHGENSIKAKPPGCLESPTGLCRVESGPNGEFSFPVLQPGSYRLVPHYAASKEGIAFDVRPKELKFTVKHNSLTLTPDFQVKGFTVTGNVRFSKKGAGVPDAKIFLNGQQRALAGQDGNFRLENMQAGNYRLSAVADKLEFPTIDVRISPSSPILPDLLPSAFAVCGIVHQQEAHLPLGVAPGPRTIQAVSLPDKVRVLNTNTDESGIYCIMLSPGEYQMSVVVTDNEVKKGLKFSPSTRNVNVINKSISVIDFSPLRATLSGRIRCVGKCADTVTLSLVSADEEIPPALQTITDSGSYTFKDVLPGQYDLHIRSEQRSLCWRDDVQKIVVSSAITTVPDFIQTGYTMSVKSSHDTIVDYFNLDNVKIASLQMHRGSNEFCVPGPGPYMIVPVSCHEFPAPWFSWELATGPVVLEAVKHKFGGVIHSSELHDDIVVLVTREDGSKTSLGPLKGERGPHDFKYRFEVLAKPREELKMEPSAEKLIFSPTSKTVSVGDDCLADAVVFKGEKGYFVEGRVNPALEGVEVKISQGGEQIAVMITDKTGQYKIGPLPTPSPGNEYEISAEREGYQMSKIENGVFEARKLAEVVVTVTDSSDGSPLAGVLLSLSGGNYRKNSQAGPDGALSFHSLWPGEYFLRPKLKEYKFEPQSKIIAVAEGATVQVKVSGKRVAFSCIGVVTSLSGEAEPGVIIEAIGTGDACKNQQEESISEVNGQFRIRGLQPKCEYSLRLKQGVEANQHISRISPSNLKIQAKDTDVTDIRIIAWRPPPNCDVAVHVVNCPSGVNLRVRLYRESEPESVMYEKKLEPSTVPQHYFILPVLPNDGKSYFVQLDPIGNQQKRVESLTAQFSANSSFRYIKLELGTPSIGPSRGDALEDEKSTKGSIIFFTLAAVLAIAYFNQDFLLPIFNQIGGVVRQVIASASAANSNANPAPVPLDEDLMVEPVSKKKAKLRKA